MLAWWFDVDVALFADVDPESRSEYKLLSAVCVVCLQLLWTFRIAAASSCVFTFESLSFFSVQFVQFLQFKKQLQGFPAARVESGRVVLAPRRVLPSSGTFGPCLAMTWGEEGWWGGLVDLRPLPMEDGIRGRGKSCNLIWQLSS